MAMLFFIFLIVVLMECSGAVNWNMFQRKSRDSGSQCDANWTAHNGNGCQKYGQNNYCKKTGDHYGSAWEASWETFDKWADAEGRTALICPQCGCNDTATQSPMTHTTNSWRTSTVVLERRCSTDEDCDHDGECPSGRCVCTKEFGGDRCQNYNATYFMGKYDTNKKKDLVKCTDKMRANGMNCSSQGWLCPYVECDSCLVCETKKVVNFTAGLLANCVLSETCVNKTILPNGFTMEGDYEVVACNTTCQSEVVEPFAGDDKCQIYKCQVKPEPTKPPKTPCEDFEEVDHSTCPASIEWIKKPLRWQEAACVAPNCEKRTIEGTDCVMTCEEPTVVESNVTDNCYKEVYPLFESSTDPWKCAKHVQKAKKTCEDLGEHYFVLAKTLSDSSKIPDIDCNLDEKRQIVRKALCGCAKVECEKVVTRPCFHAGKKECKHYEESGFIGCSEDSERCKKEHCILAAGGEWKEKKCTCLPARTCPPGTELSTAACPLNQTECGADQSCCDKKCPATDAKTGRRTTNVCKPIDCTVCGKDLDEEETTCNSDFGCECDNADYECKKASPAYCQKLKGTTNWSLAKLQTCCPALVEVIENKYSKFSI